jgi:hypothetical protein
MSNTRLDGLQTGYVSVVDTYGHEIKIPLAELVAAGGGRVEFTLQRRSNTRVSVGYKFTPAVKPVEVNNPVKGGMRKPTPVQGISENKFDPAMVNQAASYLARLSVRGEQPPESNGRLALMALRMEEIHPHLMGFVIPSTISLSSIREACRDFDGLFEALQYTAPEWGRWCRRYSAPIQPASGVSQKQEKALPESKEYPGDDSSPGLSEVADIPSAHFGYDASSYPYKLENSSVLWLPSWGSDPRFTSTSVEDVLKTAYSLLEGNGKTIPIPKFVSCVHFRMQADSNFSEVAFKSGIPDLLQYLLQKENH